MVETLNKYAFDSVFELVMGYISSVFTGADRAKTVKAVRDLLNEYLVGQRYSVERKNLETRYSNNVKGILNWNELHLFLDCVLDESWVNFNSHWQAHQLKTVDRVSPFYALNHIQTVIDHCPQLKEFSMTLPSFNSSIPREHEVLIAKSFLLLENLTNLHLACASPPSSDFLPFFTQLGNSCPKLVYLKLGEHFPFNKEQCLALVLGEKVNLLSESIKQQIWNNKLVQFNYNCTTPICSSLKYLHTHSSDDYCMWSLILLLRHVPELELLNICPKENISDQFSKVLTLLHTVPAEQLLIITIPAAGLQWTFNAPPPGKNSFCLIFAVVSIKVLFYFTVSLKLKKFKEVFLNISSSKVMRAVASLCPRLKNIYLRGCWSTDVDDELISPLEIEFLFSNYFREVKFNIFIL